MEYFGVDKGSSSRYSRSGKNQGWNYRRYEEGFHQRYKLWATNQGWNHYRGEEQRRYWQDWAEQDDHKEDNTHLSESPKSKGSAGSPRGKKDDFSSLKSKVNSHVDAIKMLEGKLSLLSAQLTSKTPMKDNEKELDAVTRSGKVAIGNVMEDEDPQNHEKSQNVEKQELPIRQNLTKEPHEEEEQQVQVPKVMHL
ncbi:hypothetical protein KY290_033668 [Solanum tuberosum]|uniref:Uncharacterized protein n=1 Tax=Solanum tuberosum TaxID=4113 RepID=A0ABQ7U1H7_SOLTU|nr:hypothetical protein KY290_033668 [Solanum tuberosum]